MDISALSFAARIFSQFLAFAPTKTTWNNIKRSNLLNEWFIHSSSLSSFADDTLWHTAHDVEEWESVAADFTNLFLCDEEYLKAPPYASFYLDKSGELFTQESRNVADFYRRFSFQTILLPTEPSDHIAIELEFLSLLLHSMERNDAFAEYVRHYLESFLLPWVFVWCEDVKANAQSFFYKGLAQHIESYCRLLVESFNVQITLRNIHRKAS